ncbi:hypothetical protein [Methylobacterium tardum]|nr:hypothetical protein [Methylobacterium tardum]
MRTIVDFTNSTRDRGPAPDRIRLALEAVSRSTENCIGRVKEA